MRARARLREYLGSLGWPNLDEQVENHLALSAGFEERFAFLDPFVPPAARDRLLVSGCAAGSEMLVARVHGFAEVVGTEVDPHLLAIAKERLPEAAGFRIDLCEGPALPYPDGSFGTVVSGHVIEHSRAPLRYLAEHLRVLRPGGVLFLEFPHRYHPVELHTQTPSAEALPWPLRDLALRLRAARFRKKDPTAARAADGVRVDLRPVSLWQVRLYLRLLRPRTARVRAVARPAPGIVRLVVELTAPAG